MLLIHHSIGARISPLPAQRFWVKSQMSEICRHLWGISRPQLIVNDMSNLKTRIHCMSRWIKSSRTSVLLIFNTHGTLLASATFTVAQNIDVQTHFQSIVKEQLLRWNRWRHLCSGQSNRVLPPCSPSPRNQKDVGFQSQDLCLKGVIPAEDSGGIRTGFRSASFRQSV